MNKQRLDLIMVAHKLAETRSQAENYIKLGIVKVNGKIITKAGYYVDINSKVELMANERYVSRAGLKLASIANDFKLDFKNKVVLDVGSSTGGFTDYALQNGAKKVIAVDVGTDQLHSSLQGHPKIELYEKTDIRKIKKLSTNPDIVLVDVSFVSLKNILPFIVNLSTNRTSIIAMLKPQFEADSKIKHKGVIKNERFRRQIIKDFELWLKKYFVIKNKADSKIAGASGNLERFYFLVLAE